MLLAKFNMQYVEAVWQYCRILLLILNHTTVFIDLHAISKALKAVYSTLSSTTSE